MSTLFSQKTTIFHERRLPEEGYLIGYALLIDSMQKTTQKRLPLPERLAMATEKHQRYDTPQWQVFTKRHKPKDDLGSHLVFALKYEGIDLYLIKMFFLWAGREPVLDMIKSKPSSQYTRRIWFLYEWLMGIKLEAPDLKTGNYIEVVNPKLQYPGLSVNSSRHRVRNNLPGTPEFCPLIQKTNKIESFIAKDLSKAIEEGLKNQDKELVQRTAAFLLLKDSKASFAIEGEYPSNDRAKNWGRVIGQAGKRSLSLQEIEYLQNIVVGSKKLRHMGIRKTEGFIGEHDRETFSPIPDHISAKAKDLPSLMKGLIETNQLLRKSAMDPVLAAALIAFGFVFIHPLVDGNGRIHRYLIHHILIKMGYTKRDLIFPVSAAILNRMGDYQNLLEAHSHPRLELIEWRETADHNIEILNETIDLYRYYDLTKAAEFLYECAQETIDTIIPEELEYLKKYDQLYQFINQAVALPKTKVDLLIKLLNKHNGKLPKKRRRKKYKELSDKDVKRIEERYSVVFVD